MEKQDTLTPEAIAAITEAVTAAVVQAMSAGDKSAKPAAKKAAKPKAAKPKRAKAETPKGGAATMARNAVAKAEAAKIHAVCRVEFAKSTPDDDHGWLWMYEGGPRNRGGECFKSLELAKGWKWSPRRAAWYRPL